MLNEALFALLQERAFAAQLVWIGQPAANEGAISARLWPLQFPIPNAQQGRPYVMNFYVFNRVRERLALLAIVHPFVIAFMKVREQIAGSVAHLYIVLRITAILTECVDEQ